MICAVPVSGLPIVRAGDDLVALVGDALACLGLVDGDVICVTSKVVSRARGRVVRLADVVVSNRARELAAVTGKDAALVELVLREAVSVSRAVPGVLIVRHRLGLVSANAAIDASNVGEDGAVLLLPVDPDAEARAFRDAWQGRFGVRLGVVITDSLGRPFRQGPMGSAIGVAGLPALVDHRGEPDLFGRELQATLTALADQVAALSDLAAGQGAEGTPVVLVRGVAWEADEAARAADLQRPWDKDLYA